MRKLREYDAIFFRQPGNPEFILANFVVGVSDLLEWVGFPRKRETDAEKILFQRPINDSRLENIRKHFENCVTPNSLFITLKKRNITNLNEINANLQDNKPIVDKIKLDISDVKLNIENKEDLLKAINRVVSSLNERLNHDETKYVDEIEEDDDFTDSKEDEILAFDVNSHLNKTLDYLNEAKEKLESDKKLNNRENITEFCQDYLKPAFLVDGQHRTLGAYKKIMKEYKKGNEDFEIYMPVSAIVNSDWKESVFQFVILNQTAEKIDNKFLSSIISSSLTNDELICFKEQLINSGAPVFEALIINKLNSLSTITIKNDSEELDNPFYNNIQHNIPEESENAIRYNTVRQLYKRCRILKSGGSSTAFGEPYERFENTVLNDLDISKDDWENKHWIKFFIIFWDLIRKRFTSDGKLRYEKLEVDEKGNIVKGTKLSLKVSMLYLQDYFIDFIVSSYNMLKKLLNDEIIIVDNEVDYFSIKEIFDEWCEQHKKDYDFFETEWKGQSEFSREKEKYEAIDSAFKKEHYKKYKLFTG
ncbi:MAG: hypothetical protein ACOCRX_03630 [Candidatus Woesearchaeota archaeon]